MPHKKEQVEKPPPHIAIEDEFGEDAPRDKNKQSWVKASDIQHILTHLKDTSMMEA